VRDVVFKAMHSVIDKADTVVAEDLTRPIKDKKKYGRDQSCRLAGWVKGTMAEALTLVSSRRRASVQLVNCAYTSQMDSRYGVFMGERCGESFHCFDGDVLDADHNAARNILARMGDREIQRFTPYAEVKAILLERTEQKKRLGLLNQDTSCRGPINDPLSTVSELPFDHEVGAKRHQL
jgi:transposase